MQEFSVRVAYVVKPTDNITDDVITNAEHWPSAVGLKRKLTGTWAPVTWHHFAEQVRELAAGFVAAGIQSGDRVALMSRTRYEWAVLDYAILSAGAVVVPIYPTSSADQIEWILSDSGAVAAVIETDDHAKKIEAVRAKLPALAHVWQIDGTGPGGLEDIRARGADVTAEQVEERRRTRGAADLAEVVYTSGTTGRPKGCMLSHGNIVANTRNCMENDGFRKVFNERHSSLLFLPLAHSYAQLIMYGAIHTRTVLGLVDMADAVDDLLTFKPTALLSVPRVWQKVYNTAQRQAAAEGHGKIFASAERSAIAYSQAQDTGGPGIRLRLEHAQFDLLVYSKLRAALGGAVEYAWSAAAPLDQRLGHFFRGCGITILEGYGLTETSPAATSNTLDARKMGTVGRPIPGCTIRIAPDGEVLVKGHMVFQGYWHNETATKEMIDSDGWLHTGDLGALDDEGFLTITGRKKDLIITAYGKNVAPAILEERLRTHWLISECLVVGDARPFVGVLVVGDPEALGTWKAKNRKPETASMADLVDDPTLRAEIQAAIDYANEAVSAAEAIKKFAILPDDFTEAGGQMTPTLKVRRNVVMKQYEAQIAALYGDLRRAALPRGPAIRDQRPLRTTAGPKQPGVKPRTEGGGRRIEHGRVIGVDEVQVSWAADELGPGMVAILRPCAGVEAVVVIDNVTLGPAIGGVRLRPDVTAGEVARLARAMTLKNALAGLPHGGGKSGIAAPGAGPADHERVMRAFARAIQQLTDYIPGPDMGTNETSMAYVHDEIGRSVGLPAVLGGIPLDELGATGFGLAVCADVLSETKLVELGGARVVIQGFGAVGGHAARLLAERGAVIIAASDSQGATWDPGGLDVAALIAHKRSAGLVAGFPGGRPVPRDDILGLDCEILVPAAQPDVVTLDNAEKISARVILEGANIPVTAEAESQLAARGVLCIPDVVANAGGVICAAAEYRGAGHTEAFAEIREKIRDTTSELLDRMRPGTMSPRAAADQIARERLRQALALRRKF